VESFLLVEEIVMKNLKKELFELKVELDVIQQVECSKDEEKQIKELLKHKQLLSDDIHTASNDTHFRFVHTDLSKEELDELLLYRQIQYLKTIKDCMIFFVVLTVIAIICILIVLNRS